MFDSQVSMKQMLKEDVNIFKKNRIKLIDFGGVCYFCDTKTGEHQEKRQLSEFKGNMIFASANQMNLKSTSRRDDLISLFYIMVFLL